MKKIVIGICLFAAFAILGAAFAVHAIYADDAPVRANTLVAAAADKAASAAFRAGSSLAAVMADQAYSAYESALESYDKKQTVYLVGDESVEEITDPRNVRAYFARRADTQAKQSAGYAFEAAGHADTAAEAAAEAAKHANSFHITGISAIERAYRAARYADVNASTVRHAYRASQSAAEAARHAANAAADAERARQSADYAADLAKN